jgi:hypothetical protein
MAMYHRVGFTAGQSAELWERWKKGEGLKSIGRAFGKPSSCIFAHLRPSGGIMPPARRRSRLALTMAEREEISRGIVEGQSVRAIARMLARAASTVSREISRNGGVGRYRAATADKLAWKQALRPKSCKLAMHGQLRQAVVRKLELNWSPEQIVLLSQKVTGDARSDSDKRRDSDISGWRLIWIFEQQTTVNRGFRGMSKGL